MNITRIRIPSEWRDSQRGLVRAVADFQLGEGPCGKTVVRLEVNYLPHAVEIVQVCSCTERKTFLYPMHTITGRVEVTYG